MRRAAGGISAGAVGFRTGLSCLLGAGELRCGPTARRQRRVGAPGRRCRAPRRRTELRRRPRPRAPLIADGVAMDAATGRVPGAVTDEKPKAEVFRIELILVAFEVHLRDQAGKEHVAEPDEAGDRGAILMRRLLVVADVAHGAEQDVLVDAVLVDDFAAVHRAAAAVD